MTARAKALVESVATAERDRARARIGNSVARLRSYLDDIERAVARGYSPSGEAANMGLYVARIAEDAGKLDALGEMFACFVSDGEATT